MGNTFVSDLFRYALKSGRPEAQATAIVGKNGVDGDRNWMVIDENGPQLTAREAPLLLSISARELPDGSVTLTSPGRAPLVAQSTQRQRNAVLFRKPLQVLDAGNTAADWLGSLLGRSARLVRRFAATQRNYARESYGRFGDLAPVLIVNRASLNALNSNLAHPIGMNRFRPNIVLEHAQAFAEDGWGELIIADTVLKIIEPCARCVLTTIDPANGRRDLSREPLRSLSRYRANDTGDIHFGVYAQVLKGGDISTGDAVEIRHRPVPRVYEVRTPLDDTATDHRVLRLSQTEPAAENARHLWWNFDDGEPTDIQPGQFVSLRAPQSDGTQLARSFTISGQRDEGRSIRLSVRQQGEGGVSEYMVQAAKAGDTIWVTGVHGEFVMPKTDTPALFISAGSGVTPFLAFVTHLTEQSDVHHFHLDRTPDRAIGIEPLEQANSTLPGFHLHTQWTAAQGRLQASQLAEIPTLATRQIWICGPAAFVDDVRGKLKALNIPDAHIRFETFAAPTQGHATNTYHTVTLDDGSPVQVDAGLSLLSALRARGQILDSSCEMGSCQSCALRLIDGTCHETVPSKQIGFVLPCTSFARSNLRLARPIDSRVG